MRDNLAKLPDVVEWAGVVRDDGVAVRADGEGEFLAEALRLLPEEPWDETPWGTWTKAIQAATGRKGKALFLPLRLALTGRDHGPEMKRLLPVIGRRATSARLS